MIETILWTEDLLLKNDKSSSCKEKESSKKIGKGLTAGVWWEKKHVNFIQLFQYNFEFANYPRIFPILLPFL